MMEVTLQTRCRRCPECMAYRARIWRSRAIAECAVADRTWFGTLTASPEHHYMMEMRARARIPAEIWEGHAQEARFHELATEFGREVTKWLKRVRKNGGRSRAQRELHKRELILRGEKPVIEPAAFRYLITFEVHDSDRSSPEMRGRPHMHCLLHETAGGDLRKAGLQESWKLGHSTFKLVEGVKPAMYVTKYLTKASEARVRASENYGSREPDDALSIA